MMLSSRLASSLLAAAAVVVAADVSAFDQVAYCSSPFAGPVSIVSLLESRL